MKLYENVVIGNFLYGLGVAIGRRTNTNSVPSRISLLQQTPVDKTLGDVLLDFPGVLRLIEFKASTNHSDKEEIKHRKLSNLIKDEPELEKISLRVHWYIETAPSASNGVIANISPYLFAFNNTPKPKEPQALGDFIESVANEAISTLSQGRNKLERNYLRYVRWCHGEEGNTGAGALVVVVNAGGGISFIALDDIMELDLTYEQWFEYKKNMELDNRKQLQKELEIDTPSREWGLER